MKEFGTFLRSTLFLLALLAGFGPLQADPSLPSVLTLPATGMTNTVAMLNGTVNPGGAETAAWFEWGTTANYGSRTLPVAMGSGADALAMGNSLSELAPGVIYHACGVASNALGVVRGNDVLFGSPPLALNGEAVMTNECHVSFADPGAAVAGVLRSVAAGYNHSLAVRSDGGVRAWGLGGDGQTNLPNGLGNVVAVAGGELHSLALKGDGTVAAWGYNAYGQTDVPSDLSNVTAIAAGNYHSLALKGDGTVAAWGHAFYGQTNVPAGLSNVVAIAAGEYFSLALTGGGTVAAWGYNGGGQTSVPAGLSNVVAIAAGLGHGLALKNDGTVISWGVAYGPKPVPVGLSNVVAMAAGVQHSLALKNDGTVVAWGGNNRGQTNVPAGLSNVVAIASGANHVLALRSDGTITAWGDNAYGQGSVPAEAGILFNLAIDGDLDVNVPGSYRQTYMTTNALGGTGTVTRTVVVQDTRPPVITLLGTTLLTNYVNMPFLDPGATALDACGGSFPVTSSNNANLAVAGQYPLTYFSTDSHGNTATRARVLMVLPRPVVKAVTLLARGTNTQITLNGTINPDGAAASAWFEWGTATDYGNQTPLKPMGSGTAALAVSHTLSNLTPGVIYHGRVAGSNWAGIRYGGDVQFGTPLITVNGGDVVTNECHSGYTNAGGTATFPVLDIANGGNYNMVLKADGRVTAWGGPTYGQSNVMVGATNAIKLAQNWGDHNMVLKSDGKVTVWGGGNLYGEMNVPNSVSNVVDVAVGRFDCMALKADGTIATWGSSPSNQIGWPTDLTNVLKISGGAYHRLALKEDGTVAAGGNNAHGQANVPAGLSNVTDIAGGYHHSLALKADGTVVAWGSNSSNQTMVPEGLSNVVAISAGGFHSLALRSDGTVVAWGANADGQTNVPPGLNDVKMITAAFFHNLVLRSNGTLVAWGRNSDVLSGLDVFSTGSSGTVDTNEPGLYTLTYTRTNILGGLGTATRTVLVRDSLPPTVSISGSRFFTHYVNTSFTPPIEGGTDLCSGFLSTSYQDNAIPGVPGTYTNFYIATDSSGNKGSNSIVVTKLPLPPFVARQIQFTNGSFSGRFTNMPGVSFTVFASTNLSGSNWTSLGSAVESPASSGQFRFTDPQATNHPNRFYRIRSP